MKTSTANILIASNTFGVIAALIALWTGQTSPRMTLAYLLGASIPASIVAYDQCQRKTRNTQRPITEIEANTKPPFSLEEIEIYFPGITEEIEKFNNR